ncbi:hypothetical protein BT69DRAFT_1234308, partial [Atractiella rhizophila]
MSQVDPLDDLIYVREAWQRATAEGQGGTFIATDIEAWEMDNKILTEVGLASLTIEPNSKGGRMTRFSKHFIIKEHANKRNGKWVEDNRDGFAFGLSETLPASEIISLIHSHVQASLIESKGIRHPPLFIVHDHIAERSLLRKLGYPESGLISPTEQKLAEKYNAPPADAVLVDTQRLFAAWEKESMKNCRHGLERICKALGLRTHNMHNAGNDAYYTLEAFIKLAS